ncbi:MAG: hypothetical protein WCI89_02935 [bacterium]
MDTAEKNLLRKYAYNVTSSDGEDGIIERIFEVVGAENKWCLELGALNGTHDSNVWNLINNKGWSSLLIEADPTYFKKLAALYAQNSDVLCLNEFVTFEGAQRLDALLAKTPIPKDFDLFVLDIDGSDYHLWDSLKEYQPRVVCVEFNQTIPNDISFVQPRDMTVFQGSSLGALKQLAGQKGYDLVATTGANAFFVRTELFPLFNIVDNSLDVLHPDTQFHTRLYQLYDGTLVLDGYQTLFWHKIPVDVERLQVLPKSKRHYPAQISSSAGVRRLKEYVRTLPVYPYIQKIRKLL